jgi:hypothetical protein
MTTTRLDSRAIATPMTIGIMGPPLTGKGAFISSLALELRRDGHKVATVTDLSEHAQRLGIPVLERNTWESALWFLTRGISSELEARMHADIVLVNGAVPDALAYYLAARAHRGSPVRSSTVDHLEPLVRKHCSTYGRLFRTTLGSTTSANTAFDRLVDHWSEQITEQYEIGTIPVPPSGHEAALHLAIDFVSRHMK